MKTIATKVYSLDPRVKLLFIIPANILLFTHAIWQKELLVVVFFAIILLVQKQGLGAIYYVIYFLVGLQIEWYILPNITGFWLTFVAFFAVTSRKLLPAIMAGRIFFQTTSVSELMVAMKKLHFPQYITIPIAVVMRFFPSIGKDWQSIRIALKMRGIGVTNSGILRHPIQFFEYMLVPFLMAAVKTSDELAAAALSRGIDNPGKHTALYEPQMRRIDYLVMLVTIVLTIYLIV